MKWYVLQVYSAQEKKVKQAIEDHKDFKEFDEFLEQVLLPIENVSEVKGGKQTVVEKRLWPGYLMIKMNLTDEAWLYVKKTAGVIDFLGGDKPTALSDREIEEILKDLNDKKQKVIQKHKFEVGDRVKIIDGVFVNFMGTVQEVFHDKGRLSVLVTIFGRETRVDDLEFIQVEEITDDAETT